MKAKTFENLIRKIVREEIDYALRREIKSLKEDLRDNIKPTITEQHEPPTLKDKIMGTPPTKKHTPQNFTNNNTLNDLLNETAMGDTNTSSGMSPVSMGGDFSTVEGLPEESVPEVVSNAVNRDYSSLMEAIKKKKNK